MSRFKKLVEHVAHKKGDMAQLEAMLPAVKSADELRQAGDDRYLSAMTRCVFRAGFVWKVIDNKWPAFEEAFDGFNPLVIAHYPDEKLEALAQDTRIVRNFTKICSVRANAVLVLDIQQSHGSFGDFIADWPEDNIVGLWELLKKRGSRLGGNSGPMMLRLMGKDTFILSDDVKAALVNQGFLDSLSPTSKRDLQRVQAVFNELREESGRPLSHISRILAHTV